MSEANFHVRRATVDDLPALHGLWAAMNFSAPEMERHLTDFQLVESSEGNLLGALALEIVGRDGKIHAEAFNDFGLADHLRTLLWERMRSLAHSRGVARLWTAETAPFWKQNDFEPADADILKNLPLGWTTVDCAWLQLQLRDEAAIKRAVEVEFNRLKQEEARRTSGQLDSISTIRYLAIALAVVVAIVGVIFCIYLLRHYPQLLRLKRQ